MSKIKKALEQGIFWLLITLIVVIIFSHLLGYRYYYVGSSSMEPEIKEKSLIIVKKVKVADVSKSIKIGDDITYTTSNGSTLTHRVVAIDWENQKITTQGIRENASLDQPISFDKIIGKKVLVINSLSYLLNGLQNIYLLMMIIISILIIIIIKYLIKKPQSTNNSTK